jgi:hypothetical protein
MASFWFHQLTASHSTMHLTYLILVASTALDCVFGTPVAHPDAMLDIRGKVPCHTMDTYTTEVGDSEPRTTVCKLNYNTAFSISNVQATGANQMSLLHERVGLESSQLCQARRPDNFMGTVNQSAIELGYI